MKCDNTCTLCLHPDHVHALPCYQSSKLAYKYMVISPSDQAMGRESDEHFEMPYVQRSHPCVAAPLQ